MLQTREANLKRKVEDLSSLQQLQEKLKDLMNMHAWAQVVAEEKVRQQWANPFAFQTFKFCPSACKKATSVICLCPTNCIRQSYGFTAGSCLPLPQEIVIVKGFSEIFCQKKKKKEKTACLDDNQF